MYYPFTIGVAKIKTLISITVTAKLICTFVFAFVKCCFCSLCRIMACLFFWLSYIEFQVKTEQTAWKITVIP